MEIKIRDIKDISVVDIDGAIDINSSELLEAVSWLIKNKRYKLLLNLEKVDFVDYSGLSILAIIHKNINNKNGILKICNVALHIIALFRAANMLEVFNLATDEESAIKSFETAASDKKERTASGRRFQRLDIKITVSYSLLGFHKDKLELFSAKVLNISGAGLFLYTADVFPAGERVALELFLSKEKEPIPAEGIIIWLADKNLQPDSYPGMGIQFSKISPEDNKRLLDFIDKNVTHRAESNF